MSAEERDKILEDITKTSHRDLDDELKRRHAEIKDEFRREQSKMQEEFKKEKNNVIQLLHEQFNQAVNRLKESIKKGDYDGEVAQRMTADWLNSELKKEDINLFFSRHLNSYLFSFL
jgi:anthranilate/para-aminobenzoate synthase component I